MMKYDIIKRIFWFFSLGNDIEENEEAIIKELVLKKYAAVQTKNSMWRTEGRKKDKLDSNSGRRR